MEDGNPRIKGSFDRTAGQLIEALANCEGDIGKVMGDYNPAEGPGYGSIPWTEQVSVMPMWQTIGTHWLSQMEWTLKTECHYQELELPVACLVYSGGKSLTLLCGWMPQTTRNTGKRGTTCTTSAEERPGDRPAEP